MHFVVIGLRSRAELDLSFRGKFHVIWAYLNAYEGGINVPYSAAGVLGSPVR